MIIKVSINRLLDKEALKVKTRQSKKLDVLILEKQLKDGIKPNPNKFITNLSGLPLTTEETDILLLGAKHGFATRPKETDIIVIVESIWDQLERLNVLKDNHMSRERAKMALRSFAYSYLDVDVKQYGIDSKRLKILRRLKHKCVILKPDKGSGIVLIKHEDYLLSLNKLFLDVSKFEKVHHDPTLKRMSSLQRYLHGLFCKGEISEEGKKGMRPMAAQLGRAHGLPVHSGLFQKAIWVAYIRTWKKSSETFQNRSRNWVVLKSEPEIGPVRRYTVLFPYEHENKSSSGPLSELVWHSQVTHKRISLTKLVSPSWYIRETLFP